VSLIDAHCHSWARWPYQPPVPDPDSRAAPERLLYEMDRHGVETAVLICAAIGDNADNFGHALAAAERYPGRFVVFPDIDCRWSATYRAPGGAERLATALERFAFRGFTYYLDDGDDGGWMVSPDGRALFGLAAERGLICSLSSMPHQMPAVVALAGLFPTLPMLVHHHGFLGPRSAATPDAPALVLAAAGRPNIFVKVSGMGNCAGPEDEFPYPALGWVPQALYRAFGPQRLIWGSDDPVSRRHMTYGQTLSMVTRHGPWSAVELPPILGGTMARLLAGGGV